MESGIYQSNITHVMKARKEVPAWLGSVDIGFLTETERDMIIDVLRRDEKLRTFEKKRIIQLKSELRDVRRKGAKKIEVTYSTHVCERCNASTGHIINKAYTCPICKHKICMNCRIHAKDQWICIVCYKENKIKAKSGEWFYEAMRAELKPLADGSTLLKRAVLETSRSKRSVHRTRRVATPEIKYTPASSSSSSRRSSCNKSPDRASFGSMESLSSSTESHSRSLANRLGPAETGSIESLRSLRYLNRDCFSDSDHSVSSIYSSSYKSGPTSSFSSPMSGRATLASPPTKPPLDTQSLPRDPSSPNQRASMFQFPHSENSTLDKSDSHKTNSLKHKLHKAGRKLQSHRALSRSVPSLQPSKPPVSPSLTEANSLQPRDDTLSTEFRKLSASSSDLTQSRRDEEKGVPTGAGEIKFSLEYDYKSNHLLVCVVECRGLRYADIHRKSCDPYVKCYLLPDKSVKRKTTPKKHTSSPKFHQTLKFPVDISELGNRTLEMSVWNAATFSRNSFLGHLQVGLDSWKWQPNPTPHWYPLKQKELLRSVQTRPDIYQGDIEVSISYKPPDKCLSRFGELHVMLKQAKNLMPLQTSGTVDAFARVVVLPEKDVQEKTNVISGNTNPMWNARFRLPLLHRPVEGSGLEITLWRKPRGSTTSKRSRRLMFGGVRLASGKFKDNDVMSTTEEERQFWSKLCASNGSWIDASLSLRSF